MPPPKRNGSVAPRKKPSGNVTERSGAERSRQPPSELPKDKAQCSFSDPELKMMPQSNKGWDYATNAQMGVDGAFQIIVACFVTAAVNDKEQGIPLAQAAMENFRQADVELPKDESGDGEEDPGNAGQRLLQRESGRRGWSRQASIRTWRRGGRSTTRASLPRQRRTALPEEATAKEKMQAKVNTPEGQKLYAQRKTIVEPVFGQIKGARGFRRFSFRGLLKIGAEWSLLCLTHNLLKIWRHGCAPMTI